MFYECDECSFQTNSRKSIDIHVSKTGHEYTESKDYEESE